MTPRVYRYYLPRLPNHEDEWSIVMIDQNSGTLSIVSDWGNFMFCWGVSGRVYHDFRRELVRFNKEYVQNKLADHENTHFNADKTIQSVKQDILRLRRQQHITREDARADWNDVGSVNDAFDWSTFMNGSEQRYHSYWETAVYEPSNINQLSKWIEKSWPRLKAALRADLKKEWRTWRRYEARRVPQTRFHANKRKHRRFA